METVDLRGLACPGPVMELKRRLESGVSVVRLLVGDDLARSNVTRFAGSRGATADAEPIDGGGFAVLVRAGDATAASAAAATAEELACELPTAAGPLVVQVTGDTMGSGEAQLGALLLRSLVTTLVDLERRPDTVVLYNTGVTLCCSGSPVVEDLRRLEADGVEVLACGTCLNYLGLADQLEVGRVTDMLEIVTRLAAAGRTIRP